MPNHITNVIAIHGVPRNRMAEIFRAIHMDDVKHRNSIDFNKLIPMPKELDVECGSRSDKALELYTKFLGESTVLAMMNLNNALPEAKYKDAVAALAEKYTKLCGKDNKLLAFGQQLYENIQKYGAATWYDWSYENWGTKWNSYGYEDPAYHNADNEIEFLTAWSKVDKIMERLSTMFPDAQFYYKWADEDFGANVGEEIWQNGNVSEQNIPKAHTAEAYEMAAAIKAVDLEDMGYIYSEEDNTYHYQDDDADETEDFAMGGIT